MALNWSQDAYTDACRYAAEAHQCRRFKGTDLPYLFHVTLVAMEAIAALAEDGGLDGDLVVQCALLHDTIEDAGKTHPELAARFGPQVADGVLALSKDDSIAADLPEDDARRKQAQMLDSLERIRRQPREIWVVKMADRIANLLPPPPDWTTMQVERYREEARLIHNRLHSASKWLSERLQRRIERYPG